MPDLSRLRRFLNRWRERRLASEFDEEVRFHLERQADKHVHDGMARADAEAEARRRFGDLPRAREDVRAAHVARWPDDLLGDLRHGARVFARQPALTAVAVLTLSLGIGANAAIFSLLNAALFRPLPFAHGDRLVAIVDGLRSGKGIGPTVPELLDIRDRSRTLDGVTFFDTRDFQIEGGPEPAHVVGARVDAALLPLVGARPALGRLPTPADSVAGSSPVAVLGDALWRRSFGADPAVVGRTVAIDGVSVVVVGVLRSDFSLEILAGQPVDLYVPYSLTPAYTSRSEPYANVRRVIGIGRLAPAVSMTSASAELAVIASRLVGEHPAVYRTRPTAAASDFSIDLMPLRESVSAGARPTLLMIFGAVVLVLLIACVNTAQFLLAQAIEREPEVALRNALGASRARLVRQFLSETLLLAFAAGALGLVQAYCLIRVLRVLTPSTSRLVGSLDLDAPVLVFTAAAALLTVTLCGLVPGLRFSRAPLRGRLDPRTGTSGRGRARQVFVAVEVALSLLLLVEAGLLLRSLQVLHRAQSGFSADGVTVLRIRGTLGGAYERFLERIAATPGIAAVAIADAVLARRPETPFTIVDRADDAATRSRQIASRQSVSPAYFSVLRIPLLQGRTFSDRDTIEAPLVAIVNQEMARQYWPGTTPVGRQIRAEIGPREKTMTIVGVVGNVRPPFQTGDVPQIYVSSLQQGDLNMAILVRADAGAAAPVDAIKRAIWSVEPRQAVFDVRTLDELLSRAVAVPRMVAVLIGGFAALAFVLSTSGIFTIVSYMTSRRVKEIALRRAIGAADSEVVWLLAGQTLLWTVGGLLAGVAAATAATGALRAAVAGVIPLDAAIVGVVCGAYLLVVALAVALPARRALRIDPAMALRAE
jgi:putative ABC transport system permease protein